MADMSSSSASPFPDLIGDLERRVPSKIAGDPDLPRDERMIGWLSAPYSAIAAIASATATVRCASSRWSSSVILPFTLSTPLPALAGSAKASMTALA